ncbi:MAG TPA: antitoxin family protein [Phycisphaerae bacterium]
MASHSIEAVYERGTFRPLTPVDMAEGQSVILSLEPIAMTPAQAEAQLAEWFRVYEGLSEQEIGEIERIALDRSRFVRSGRP